MKKAPNALGIILVAFSIMIFGLMLSIPMNVFAQGATGVDLSISKYFKGPPWNVWLPGSTIYYEMHYGNVGTQEATGVILKETIPIYTTFNPSLSTTGWTCVGRTCTLNIGTVPPSPFFGFAYFVVTVDDRLPCELEFIDNSATITSSEIDLNTSNNSSSDSVRVDPTSNCYENASSCAKKPRYKMYTFRDDNQPDTWQEYCYIISNNGYPSVESQAIICSVPGYDYVYKATSMVYSGWVYTDCDGIASYGWQDWQSSWYRPQFAK
jgi:hypothetical protein